jgi:predicted O-methyltransferase YrrM
MLNVTTTDVYFETEDALIHDAYVGFKEDYLCLHSLLRKFNPSTLLEIGTNIGSGVNVMAKACPLAKIMTLDLDYKTMKLNSKQYPIGEHGEDRVGSAIRVPYVQLRGDSMTFDYTTLYPIDAWFIDGEHDYTHAHHESKQAILSQAKLIVWHDSDIDVVFNGITDAFKDDSNYDLFRVTNTRIAYAVRK